MHYATNANCTQINMHIKTLIYAPSFTPTIAQNLLKLAQWNVLLNYEWNVTQIKHIHISHTYDWNVNKSNALSITFIHFG